MIIFKDENNEISTSQQSFERNIQEFAAYRNRKSEGCVRR